MLLMKIILGLKVSMNQVMTKKPCFGFFCRFVTRALSKYGKQNTQLKQIKIGLITRRVISL